MAVGNEAFVFQKQDLGTILRLLLVGNVVRRPKGIKLYSRAFVACRHVSLYLPTYRTRRSHRTEIAILSLKQEHRWNPVQQYR